MLLAHFFVGRYQEPRVVMTKLDDLGIFDTFFAPRRVSRPRKTVYELVDNEVSGTQSSCGFSIAEAVVEEKF
jgi:hypothetical protein